MLHLTSLSILSTILLSILETNLRSQRDAVSKLKRTGRDEKLKAEAARKAARELRKKLREENNERASEENTEEESTEEDDEEELEEASEIFSLIESAMSPRKKKRVGDDDDDPDVVKRYLSVYSLLFFC